MKTDTTLRLTRTQYRAFAEQAKQAGCVLSLSTFHALGNCWGIFDPRAKLAFLDVSSDDAAFAEVCGFQLATSVDAGRLRSNQRPEIDWSALEDHEIYPFIVAHEIGHRVDNFCYWDANRVEDDLARTRCVSVIRSINEVLADRYAWNQIRPGEPVPLCELGKSLQEEVAGDIALMDKHMPRVRRQPRALPAGRYLHIPESMLMTDAHLSYVGTGASPAVIERARRPRTYRRDSRSRAY